MLSDEFRKRLLGRFVHVVVELPSRYGPQGLSAIGFDGGFDASVGVFTAADSLVVAAKVIRSFPSIVLASRSKRSKLAVEGQNHVLKQRLSFAVQCILQVVLHTSHPCMRLLPLCVQAAESVMAMIAL